MVNRKYKVTSAPSDGAGIIYNFLVGQVGVCRWGDGNAVCLTFDDGRSFLIQYHCLIGISPKRKFRSSPTENNFEYHLQIYRLCKVPTRYGCSTSVYGLIGKLCSITEYDNRKNLVIIYFDDEKNTLSVPLDCIEDVGLDIL